MDFKSLLSHLDQLNEATKETGKGRVHTAEPGGYGRKDDEDEEGKKVQQSTEKRGRGRPKKVDAKSGEDKKYDFSAFGVKPGKDIKLPKYDKSKTTKHTLKDWIEQIDRAESSEVLSEAEQVQIMPAKSDTHVIKQGSKTLGTVTNPQLAQQIKQSIGKGEMTIAGDELGETSYSATAARAGKDIGKPGKTFSKIAKSAAERYGSKERGEKVAGAVLAKLRAKESMGEALMPTDDSTAGAGLGAGRSQGVLEARATADKKKLPSMAHIKKMCKDGKSLAEIFKMHPDCDRKELKQMVADCKKTLDEASMPMTKVNGKSVPAFAADGKGKHDLKKKVKEGTEHRLKSARHMGKSHALAKEGYNCKYDDMEESRAYHEGYKEGLDECYDVLPMRGVVGEEMPVTTATMAKAADPMIDEMDMDEGNAFTGALAREKAAMAAHKPEGDGKFTVGNKKFTVTAEASPFDINEDSQMKQWDNALNSLLNETINEGLSVSVNKGQQGMPDSVSVTAQDADADTLLALVKSAGLGLFGDDAHAEVGVPVGADSHGGVDVVGDHDGMMGLIKKLSGQDQSSSQDYADEEGHHREEETCSSCGGMMEAGHSCGSNEMVDETETEDQMAYEVAEDEEVVNNDDEASEEETDSQRDAALAQAAGANFAKVDEDEEEAEAENAEVELEETYANSADDDFTAETEFMTDTITSGLNKKKSTGQTTIPVIAGQNDRMGYSTNESLQDWRKLAGIK
jgi:hypothetical protein